MMEYDTLLRDKWDILISGMEDGGIGINKIIEDYGDAVLADPQFCHYLLIRILKDWVDLNDEYYDIVASWIMGTYFTEHFMSYPYMFINAMKRSGKTRLLKLLAKLSFNGIYTAELTEAVLFRMPAARQTSMFIDEAETMNSKEKSSLRLLLNSAYKRGMKIYRTRKNPKTEKFMIDEFEIFMPIGIANINGIDDVLEDRCITIILDRSVNIRITSKPEYFDLDRKFMLFGYCIQRLFSVGSVGGVVCQKYTNYSVLNSVLQSVFSTNTDTTNTSYTTDTTNTTNTTGTTDKEMSLEELILSIIKKKIIGRDFECWYPIFIINSIFNPAGHEQMLEVAAKLVQDKKTTDIMEDRDTSVMIFLKDFARDHDQERWYTLSELGNSYSMTEGNVSMSNELMSRILKRLNIVRDKRRISSGREVMLDFVKIKKKAEQMGLFEIKEE